MKKSKWILFTLVLFIVGIYFIAVNKEKSISIDQTGQVQAVVDETSSGKAQVDWRYVSAMAEVKYGIEEISDEEIRQLTNQFITEENDDFKIKEIDRVLTENEYSQEEKEEVKNYYNQLTDQIEAADNNNLKKMQRNFINDIEAIAIENYETYRILPSITIAQAILESDWGRSTLSSEYNNYFGIKSHNWDGESVNLETKEYYDETIEDAFRVYDQMEDSVKDHGEFLATHDRYKKNGLFNGTTYMEQAVALQDAGYSTIENEQGEKIYSDQLAQIIQQHQLQLIDSKVYQ
ncbi:glucosaminidase domain-containing protein [Cytobacillus sp. FSL R7-0696]|uniref:glucosaminidase domain-containing protein n=1 Tax=Cytobacillus sp. FSL R7-0696 TaxID=2921691 RepID=UPI0030FB1375